MSTTFLLFWGLLLASCVAARIWGGDAERRVATMYLVAAVATVVIRPALPFRYGGVEAGVFFVDAMLLAGLASVVASSREWWVACALALHCVSVLGHVGRWLNPNLLRLGYQLMAEWTAWPTLLLLTCATLARAVRRRPRRRATSAGYSVEDRPARRSRTD